MTDHKAFGERVRFYRKRRGLHQRELGELLNRTEDWVYRVESGRIPVNNVKMLMDLAEALRVHLEDLQGAPTLLDDQGDHKASVPAIRVALMQSRRLSGPLLDDREPPRLERLTFEVGQAWELYQGSAYARLGETLPGLVADARLATFTYTTGLERVQALRQFALAFHLAAVYLRKLGETNLAWTAVDHGDLAASETEDPAVILALRRGVAHVQLGAGMAEQAVNVTTDAVNDLAPGWWQSSPEALSVYGTLYLNGAVAAARMRSRDRVNDHREVAEEMLRKAGEAAALLGGDGNEMWTSFGPANVKIHKLTIALEYEDYQSALDMIPSVRAAGLPVERRARLRLDVARTYGEVGRTDDSADQLKKAFLTAPEQIRAHEFARDLAGRLHKRTRRRDVQELALKLGAIK
ncbi:helix-turn-helix domain-containing protein [Streptomyces sp. ET3-23]|uniref:helix-turn-helix domain-containing protein n=1 Tax=Streptomyces sp. ET3-23 TaxID=2885643 RepID=UPI001D11D89D|nr:helix-turn-helix transcriptional regulator [Streptomyces sp. ET3-23]MCC2275757.1 helix-turn-helix domain-containing protein [Streptomyces sp. ET3-23]